ncbi:MAG: DUF202 domain-containing protein [bacterium]|nr:DUF202 domain-containing protein [bacterium]
MRKKLLHSDFKQQELSLRDKLAIARTILANERTLLAYFRTSLAIFITGVSLIKFFDSLTLAVIGWFFIPVGISVVFVGIKRHKEMSKQFRLQGPPEQKEQ